MHAQVMRLESHCVISNRLGIPLQLMQWRSDLTAETFDDRFVSHSEALLSAWILSFPPWGCAAQPSTIARQVIADVLAGLCRAGGGTMVSGSTRGGLPRASPQTPPQPGLRAAIRDPTVDWTSCMDLPPGQAPLQACPCTHIVKQLKCFLQRSSSIPDSLLAIEMSKAM